MVLSSVRRTAPEFSSVRKHPTPRRNFGRRSCTFKHGMILVPPVITLMCLVNTVYIASTFDRRPELLTGDSCGCRSFWHCVVHGWFSVWRSVHLAQLFEVSGRFDFSRVCSKRFRIPLCVSMSCIFMLLECSPTVPVLISLALDPSDNNIFKLGGAE